MGYYVNRCRNSRKIVSKYVHLLRCTYLCSTFIDPSTIHCVQPRSCEECARSIRGLPLGGGQSSTKKLRDMSLPTTTAIRVVFNRANCEGGKEGVVCCNTDCSEKCAKIEQTHKMNGCLGICTYVSGFFVVSRLLLIHASLATTT